MPTINESLLDSRLGKLESTRNWSPRVISKLEAFVRTADDYDLFRVDPIQYATEKGMAENEAIDLFLHASKGNIFDLEWSLICNCCGQSFASFRGLGNLHAHFVCNFCLMENNAELDDMIKVSFTVAPAIREIIYHTPVKLSAEDYMFKYCMTRGLTRGPDGVNNTEYFRKCCNAIQYLEPGEKWKLELDVSPGFLYCGDLLRGVPLSFIVYAATDQAPPPVRIIFGLPDMQVAEPETEARALTIVAHGVTKNFELSYYKEIPAGRSQWELENRLAERACVVIMNIPSNVTETWPQIPPFLTGKRLLTTQTFRDLYRSEVIEDNEGLGVRDITFLFTDLKGSTALYDKLGDLKAYHLVREHFDALNEVIIKNSGAIVKTIGDAIMATFCTPIDGIRAAIEILNAIDKFNEDRTEQLILKIGLHAGHSIAVTLNERLDYFGQTVNIASRVQELAGANEIFISKEVYNYPEVGNILEHYMITPSQVTVRGVSGTLQLYKINSHSNEVKVGHSLENQSQ
ncbi:MAG: DUF5939 domain-containing protein [Chitinophagales bacterium]